MRTLIWVVVIFMVLSVGILAIMVAVVLVADAIGKELYACVTVRKVSHVEREVIVDIIAIFFIWLMFLLCISDKLLKISAEFNLLIYLHNLQILRF
jgi:hypothetical protein